MRKWRVGFSPERSLKNPAALKNPQDFAEGDSYFFFIIFFYLYYIISKYWIRTNIK